MSKKNDTLPAIEEQFCQHYIADFNATRAASDAGYSADSAHTLGWRLLQKVEVQQRISELIAELTKESHITARRVLLEYARIAFADILNVISIEGNVVAVKNSSEWTPEDASAVAEVSQTTSGIRVKLHDKMKALEVLAEKYRLLRAGDSGDIPSGDFVVSIKRADG